MGKLNLDENWEPNEYAYLALAEAQRSIESEIESYEGIIQSNYDDIHDLTVEVHELKKKLNKLDIEDFI